MTVHPPTGGSEAESVQAAVAAIRADVLRGRGPDVPTAERAAHQHERALLGALPAPLERELVHLATTFIRAGAENADAEAMQTKVDRLLRVWDPVLTERTARLLRTWRYTDPNAGRPTLPMPPPGFDARQRTERQGPLRAMIRAVLGRRPTPGTADTGADRPSPGFEGANLDD